VKNKLPNLKSSFQGQPISGIIPTSSLSLDVALGNGGITPGQVILIRGPEGCGKTTFCHHFISNANERGSPCTFIDMDKSLDLVYAIKCGIDPNLFYFSEPANLESALGILEILVHSASMRIIVIDSISTIFSFDFDSHVSNEHFGIPSSAYFTQLLRRIAKRIKGSTTIVIFTIQSNQSIGSIYRNLVANPSRFALHLFAGTILQLTPIDTSQKGGIIPNSGFKIQIVKNSTPPRYSTILPNFMYNKKDSKIADVIELGLLLDILKKGESAYYYLNNQLGGTPEDLRTLLRDNPQLVDQIERDIRREAFSLPAHL